MAVKLDTSEGTRNVREQARKERDLKFKIGRIAIIAIAVISIGISVKNGITGYRTMQTASAEIEQTEAAYARLKDEAAAWHRQHDNDTETDENGMIIQTQQMYSAKAAGDEVAAFQTALSRDKRILSRTESERLRELTKSTGCWYGDKVREGVPLEWEFLTFYDAQVREYDCVWACWHQGNNGRYLACVQFGRYNGESESFIIDSKQYKTTFADMLDALYDGDKYTIDAGRDDGNTEAGEILEGLLAGGEDEGETGETEPVETAEPLPVEEEPDAPAEPEAPIAEPEEPVEEAGHPDLA